jgi:flagellar hook-associated protein 1
MNGISSILNIGKQALLTQQQAVNVTGHNIANANTPGFSRQRVVLQTGHPVGGQPGMSGTGVTADEIQRVSDRFVGSQINREIQNKGGWEARQNSLERVETVFDESAGFGLNAAMSEFWNSWQDLVNNPGGQTEREILVANTQNLTRTFQKIDTDLRNVQQDLDGNISATVAEVNLLAAQVSGLNEKISDTEATGLNANDYRDARDLVLNDLSEHIDFNSYEDDDGRVTVMLGDGKSLVGSGANGRLATATNAVTGVQDVVWETDTATTINSRIAGGRIGGWLAIRDTVIPEYIDRLDTLAGGIITAVNTEHQAGLDRNNQPGVAFFTGSDAAGIQVNPAIGADATLVAAARAPGRAPGDNSNAVRIAGLQQDLTMNGGAATFADDYNSLVSDVGIAVRSASQTAAFEENLVAQLENYRESVAGVSLDEEMINLVKFQNAYDAAAKLIAATDEMMGTVLNMI